MTPGQLLVDSGSSSGLLRVNFWVTPGQISRHSGSNIQDDPKDNGVALSMMLDKVGDEEFELPDIVSGLAEDDELRHITKVLFKVSREACRLRYNPGARRDFKEACVLSEVPTPHTIQCDVQICWNSTSMSLKDADRTWDGACSYQQTYQHTPREERFHVEDRQAIRGLLTVLEPLDVATLAMSKADVPLLADVVVQYDALNE
ncbi:hypothetical protein BDV93DRAFT_513918 [Ceratobasidium sp. AG-I]|nr:hypothetical protein BDV93DRAFT_513918 [Ceratobasidium sp. AG-I]